LNRAHIGEEKRAKLIQFVCLAGYLSPHFLSAIWSDPEAKNCPPASKAKGMHLFHQILAQ
jgi:hypothetical protein